MISTPLTRYAWLSIGAAVCTVSLKTTAWILTGSVGLLSDALESLVNAGAAVMLLAMLRIAARPADETHAYGRNKAEYFASGFEGMLHGRLGLESAGVAAADARGATTPLHRPRSRCAQRGHDLLEEIERRIAKRVPAVTLDTHLEPIEDPSSYRDQQLDRD